MIVMFQSESQRKKAQSEEEAQLRKIEKAKMDKPRALEVLKVDTEKFESLLEADKKEELVQLLSQFAIRETKLLQVDTQRGDVDITHLTRKLKIEDAYQFLLKHINSEALDSRRVDFMMLTGLALDDDDKLKEKTEEILEAFHTNPVNRYPREAKTKDDMVKQWLSMSDAPYNDDVFQEGGAGTPSSGSGSKISAKEGPTKKNKSKTLSTSSAEEKLGTRRKSTYQTYQEAKGTDKAVDSFKRSQSQKTQKTTKSKSTT